MSVSTGAGGVPEPTPYERMGGAPAFAAAWAAGGTPTLEEAIASTLDLVSAPPVTA